MTGTTAGGIALRRRAAGGFTAATAAQSRAARFTGIGTASAFALQTAATIAGALPDLAATVATRLFKNKTFILAGRGRVDLAGRTSRTNRGARTAAATSHISTGQRGVASRATAGNTAIACGLSPTVRTATGKSYFPLLIGITNFRGGRGHGFIAGNISIRKILG